MATVVKPCKQYDFNKEIFRYQRIANKDVIKAIYNENVDRVEILAIHNTIDKFILEYAKYIPGVVPE